MGKLKNKMKKIIFSFAFICASFVSAQGNFDTSMAEKIEKLQITEQVDDLSLLAGEFEKMGSQQDSWLTYYYASYTYVKKGKALLKANKLEEVDEVAAIAEKYALVAQEKNENSAEISILMKMIHTLRMRVNPNERYASESALSTEELQKALKLDPKNPRISIVKADDFYFMGEEFGGNKEKALKMYQTALEQFKTYKPANSIAPNWGKEEASSMISQSK